jgi:hypothetical protein
MKEIKAHTEPHTRESHRMWLIAASVLPTCCRISALAALALVISACAARPKVDTVRRETVSRGTLAVTDFTVREDPSGGLLVSGSVQKVGLDPSPDFRHLDVIALDSEGNHLAALAIRYSPWPITNRRSGYSQRAAYSVRLPINRDDASTVRVAHHETALAECKLAKQ